MLFFFFKVTFFVEAVSGLVSGLYYVTHAISFHFHAKQNIN